jgi:two-component system alkaline phosphatase synthesis response regulator PhoP
MLKKSILLVDDDREVTRLMRGYLEKAGYAVLVAHDGETALHMLRRENPDLVLLDLMLPDRDGWDITRIVREDQTLAATPIIMLSARVTDTDKILGLELGADDYITKPYNPREVVARVRARLRVRMGAVNNTGKVLRVGKLQLDVTRREVLREGQEIDLTVTEFDILRTLMEQAGYVVPRRELIRKALGEDFPGVNQTLDSHIRNLRVKIEIDPKHPKYILTEYGIGYRLTAGGES